MRETKTEPIARLDRWPKYFEVHEELDGRRRYLVVVERVNSRALDPEQRTLLEHLEDAGLRVVIRVAGSDMSLEEFERSGTHRVRPKRFTTRQEFYNRRSELRGLRREFASMSVSDSVRRENLARRIALKEALLANATNPPGVGVFERSEGLSLELLRKLVSEEMEVN
jgi:hypothetical protein